MGQTDGQTDDRHQRLMPHLMGARA